MRSRRPPPAPRARASREVMLLWYRFMRLAWEDDADDWDPRVLGYLCPDDGETFEQWHRRTADYMEPLEGAVIPWGVVEEAVEILKTSDGRDDRFRFMFTVDLRAPKTHMVRQFIALLDDAIDEVRLPPKRRGRPTGLGTNWVDFAPNGHVDVTALKKALAVHEAKARAVAAGRKISNGQLWEVAVRPLLPPGRQRIASEIAPEVKGAEVSRHLKRVREMLAGVRRGRFPFPDRDLVDGLTE